MAAVDPPTTVVCDGVSVANARPLRATDDLREGCIAQVAGFLVGGGRLCGFRWVNPGGRLTTVVQWQPGSGDAAGGAIEDTLRISVPVVSIPAPPTAA